MGGTEAKKTNTVPIAVMATIVPGGTVQYTATDESVIAPTLVGDIVMRTPSEFMEGMGDGNAAKRT